MKDYLKAWNWMRLIRLALGLFVIIHGLNSREWAQVILGALFSVMPLLNIGCCSVSGCRTPVSKTGQKTDDITYEEVR